MLGGAPLTEEEMARCVAIAEVFRSETSLWPTYVRLVADIQGIDFDLEISSPPARAYSVFMNNVVRPWLRQTAPEIDADHRQFRVFHRRIEQIAVSEIKARRV